MANYSNLFITENFLDENPNAIFVFGDNLSRSGKGGAAALRDHDRAYGFVTKKFPDNNESSFYKPEEYAPVFFGELDKLNSKIKNNQDKVFYISQLGSGLANKFRIWETLIRHNLEIKLGKCNNVIFCWE